MKELDFDELDRAVNSLMSNTPKNADTPSSEPAEKVVEIDDSSKSPTPPASTPVATPSAPAPSPSTSLPSRRGGRFMDVVHPSSDMKKPDAPRPSRSGITIAPRPSFEAPKNEPDHEAPGELEKEAPQAAPASTPLAESGSTAPTTEHPAAKSEWPDPLDMAGYTHEPDTGGAVEEKKAEEKPDSPEVEALKDGPAAPLTSPFLPDAKVEKRPLGGTEQPVEEPDHTPVVATSDVSGTQDNPNDQLPALPRDVETPLPEELHSDLVEVESDTNASGIPKTEETGEPVPASLPPEPPKQEETPVSSGPTSIPQQYHEEPTSGDKNNGAIYDTDTYHQPLAHPAKKKSGWLVVIWVAIILLVGAAGGAALYFLGVF